MFERKAIDYPLGKSMYRRFAELGVPLEVLGAANRVTGIAGQTPGQAYANAKTTLVVRVKKNGPFVSCRPSAHYQLPLATSCPGLCEYCYLQTNLGLKPYLRFYVNVDEILQQADGYIRARRPDVTVFEGAATSDPVPLEPYTGALRRTVEFFGQQPHGRFRFVTKFTDIDTLLDADHGRRTQVRFSLNGESFWRQFEHRTPPVPQRLEAAAKIGAAGYPLGFLIGPIFITEGWQDEYHRLLALAAAALPAACRQDLTFELVTHRFTARAKNNIAAVFPASRLPMEEKDRAFKYGQFGYGKYVYPPPVLAEAECFFRAEIEKHFPGSRILYLV